jgi:hypothetical protein
MAIDGKTIAIIVLVVLFVVAIFGGSRMMSKFTAGASSGDGAPMPTMVASGSSVSQTNTNPAPVPVNEAPTTQTPSALLPNEIPVSDNFGQFSAQDIIGNQNYLDPRSQIGYPGTVGGVLRNANLQYRSEPLNPRDPVSIFNLSTIVPDTMRPSFEIQDQEYQ